MYLIDERYRSNYAKKKVNDLRFNMHFLKVHVCVATITEQECRLASQAGYTYYTKCHPLVEYSLCAILCTEWEVILLHLSQKMSILKAK
jgi:hypothetical protein